MITKPTVYAALLFSLIAIRATAEPAASPATAKPATAATAAAAGNATGDGIFGPNFDVEKRTKAMNDTLDAAYNKAIDACAATAIPLDTDKFKLALIGPDGGNVALNLNALMTCREFANNTTADTNYNKFLKEPLFKSPAKSTLSSEDLKKAEAIIEKAYRDSLIDTFTFFVIKGEPNFLGKPLSDGACTLMPEALRQSCKNNIEAFSKAVDAEDRSLCSAADNSYFPAQDLCTLLITRDPSLCDITGFLRPTTPQFCRDILSLGNAIRGKYSGPLDKMTFQQNTPAFLAVLSQLVNKDNCASFFKKNFVAPYCAPDAEKAKAAALAEWDKKIEASMANIKSAEQREKEQAEIDKKLLEEDKKKREEEAKKALEDQKKKEEEKKKEEKEKDDSSSKDKKEDGKDSGKKDTTKKDTTKKGSGK